MKKGKNITRMVSEAKRSLKVDIARATCLRRDASKAPAVTCERIFSWTKKSKGGILIPRKKAIVTLVFRNKESGEILEVFKRNSLSSIQNRMDHYRACYSSLEMA